MSQQRLARSTAIALCTFAIGVGCGGMDPVGNQPTDPTGSAGSSGTGGDVPSAPGGGNDAAAGRGGPAEGGGGGRGGAGGSVGGSGGAGAPGGAGGSVGGSGGAGAPGGAGGQVGGGAVGVDAGSRGGAPGVTTSGSPVDAGTSTDAASAPTFTEIYTNILRPYCAGSTCHDPGSAKGIGFASRSSAYTAVRARVKPGNGAGSSFFKTVDSGSMPRGAPKLSPQNLAKIQGWIDAGALDN